ncbi:MAG: ABC transporter permease [Clostridiales bacterium]|nr:ABC transporter permease [Clostridiales bacterium]
MLLRKMLRDMKYNLRQFISIFIMAFLASFVFTGINAEWYGMQTVADKYYRETRLSDIWVIGSIFSKEDAMRVKDISGVEDVSLRFSSNMPLFSDNNKELNINIIDDNTLSIPKVIQGSSFDDTMDGIWLDSSFAKANGLEIGDSVSLVFSDSIIEKNILGLIIHPEHVYSTNESGRFTPDHENYGFGFLYSSSLPQDFELHYNQILIELNDGVREEDVTKELENMFSDRFILIINRDAHLSVSTFDNEIRQNKAMGGVFPIVFFLIAALSIFTTMTRITYSQRTQIGTLKALGFSKKTILLHYISYGIWIGLIGGILGLITGPLVIPPILFNMQKTLYTLPEWSIAISPVSFVIIALLALSCGISSYLACRKQLIEVPAASLRPRAPKTNVHSKIEKSRLWYGLSFAVQWNIRDIIRSKIRSIMATVGVLGCTALLLFGLGLGDTVNSVSSWMYNDLNVYEDKINIDPQASIEDIIVLGSNYTGQWIQESNIEIRYNYKKENGFLTVLDDGDGIRFEDKNKNRINLYDEGIGISYKMAELLDVKVGDIIEWRSFGQKDWTRSEVSVIYRTPMGQGLAIKRSTYDSLGQSFKPTSLLTYDRTDADSALSVVESIQNKEVLKSSFNELLDSIRMIIAILVLGAILLGSVVLYNLGALSYTERIRELATLKVLGFHPGQIRSLLRMQNIWLTILGIILGVPIGYWLVGFMLSTMPASIDMSTDISKTSVIISILGTFIVSITVNLILSRNIKRINMVSALKSVE